MWVPVDHFTFLGFSAAPTPSTDIVMIWVDDTGAPAHVDTAMDADEKTCESNEWIGSILKILRPSVFMIRHPPLRVPAAMRIAQVTRPRTALLPPLTARQQKAPGQ